MIIASWSTWNTAGRSASIGIDRRAPLQSYGKNHPSATADVEHYIDTELGQKALLGPFAGPPHHVLSLFTIDD